MAKKTKDSNLPIEERLDQALVPNWDYPYEIPKNWLCFWFTKLIDIEGGTQPPKSHFVEHKMDGYIRLVQIRDFSSDKYIVYVPDSAKLRHFEEEDILIARYGASLGKICTGLKGVYNVALAKTIFSDKILDRKYVYWVLHSEAFQNPLMAISRTAQAGFNKEDLSRFAMPLPPLAEQCRIVARIESLFSKLDEAKEKAQEVVDGFEIRKAAILHKAFSGELTAQWRDANGITKDSWILRKINQVCTSRAGYAFDSKKFTNSGYQIIRMGNLYSGELDLNRNPVFISANDIDDSILMRSLINDGDILITLTGTKYKRDYGYAVCINSPNHLLVNQRILCLTPNHNEINTDYLLFYLQSDWFRDVFFSNETGGVNQGNVSSKFVENIEFDLPTLAEQKEIGKLLRNTLDKDQQAKETAEAVIDQIDTMKKAILARAFRGELGTNDPTEESAVELLKQVLNTTAEPKKPVKRTIIPKSLESRIKTDLERKIIKLYIQNEVNVLTIDLIMSVSSKKFDIMEALRNLQQRGILEKENDKYKLLG